MMDLSRGRKRKVYDKNRPSQLIARSGQPVSRSSAHSKRCTIDIPVFMK